MCDSKEVKVKGKAASIPVPKVEGIFSHVKEIENTCKNNPLLFTLKDFMCLQVPIRTFQHALNSKIYCSICCI